MNKCFHCLERRLVGACKRRFSCVFVRRNKNFSVKTEFVVRLREPLAEFRFKCVRIAQCRGGKFLFDVFRYCASVRVAYSESYGKALRQRIVILFDISLRNAGSHGIIEVRNALTAVHFVLVCLNGDAGKRCVTHYGLRRSQITVTRAETVLEQFYKVYLTAGLGQHVEVFVVNVYISADMRLCHFFGKNIIVNVIFRAFGTVFEHRSHRGVAVDVGVLSLDVGIL